MRKLLAIAAASAFLTTSVAAHAKDPQIEVSVIKVDTEFYASLKRPAYNTDFLIQVETKSALRYLSLSCTGFDDADQPVGEVLVILHSVPANERAFNPCSTAPSTASFESRGHKDCHH